MTPRRRLFALLALTVIPSLLLLAAEAGLRISGYGYPTGFFVRVAGRDAYTTNPRFGWRFFPPAIARTPVPGYLVSPKPGGTYRVFVLGSSAAMGVPDPAFSFGRILEAMLGEQYPERRVEVINAAMTAVNSHVIAPIARDCAHFQPDLFVVYAGNNEVVGPYGPGTVFAGYSPRLPVIRLGIAARATRLGQLGGSLLGGDRIREWGGMGMFLDRRVPADDPRLERVYDHFRQNLADIVEVGRRAGAQVLISTVATNLDAQPPFASDSAMAEYRLGQSLLAQGRAAEAHAAFVRARDLDTLRFRADSRINQIVREVAGSGLVDAEPELTSSDLFWEHVHLTFDGNYRLAKLVFRKLTGAEPLSREQAAERLAYTSWNEYHMARYMFRMMSQPPFAAPPPWKAAAPAPEALAQARRVYQAALERRPADLLLRMNYARLLRESTDPAGAAVQWRALVERLPDHHLWRVELAGALSDQGRLAEAATELGRVLAAEPSHAPALFGLGVVADRQAHPAQAVASYQEALRQDPFLAHAHNNLGRLLMGREAMDHFQQAVKLEPDFAEARYNLAGALVSLGHAKTAVAHLREAVRFQPQFAEAHFSLGATLAGMNQLEDAAVHLAEAARLKPEWPDAHYNLGIVLSRQGQYAKAADSYSEALRLRPNFAQAHNNLGKALALQGKTAQAVVHFTRALELQPNLAEARQNLAIAEKQR